ncbi:hypothetical protein [Type-E symbiont of Plautia stali]|uniref:hypothetical protein n=1 Tax=Type-E symbiont of Plautia stali TaxID=1560357 RepID=UPI00073EDFDA|nr:hypothetical protein [Type-E symbiont of Plautia stali]
MMAGFAAIVFLLIRAIRNLVELIYLWQSSIKQSRFYAVRVWGARRKPLVMLLIIDTIVVVALICILSARIQML